MNRFIWESGNSQTVFSFFFFCKSYPPLHWEMLKFWVTQFQLKKQKLKAKKTHSKSRKCEFYFKVRSYKPKADVLFYNCPPSLSIHKMLVLLSSDTSVVESDTPIVRLVLMTSVPVRQMMLLLLTVSVPNDVPVVNHLPESYIKSRLIHQVPKHLRNMVIDKLILLARWLK